MTQKHCLRCGHAWYPRKPGKPAKCPNCWDPNWRVPYSRKTRGKASTRSAQPLRRTLTVETTRGPNGPLNRVVSTIIPSRRSKA